MSSFQGGLRPEEIEILEGEKIISASTNGKRKVSTGLLTPEISDGSTASSSSASTASVRVLHKALSDIQDFELPENLEYAIVELNNLERAPIREILHQPAEAMRSLGIAKEMIDRMTAPEFQDLFESETLVYWLETAMRSRYGTAGRYLDILKSRAIRTLHVNRGKKRGKLEGVFQQALAPETSTSDSATMSMESEFSGDMFPRKHVSTVQTPPENRDGYVTLYKGKSVGVAYHRQRTLILDDGKLYMPFMETYPGGDFDSEDRAWYWTKEKETAEKYRQWALNLDPFGETWIMQIQVPESFLKSVHIEYLWYGFDWKQYVWYCRKKSPRANMPQNMHKYADADVLEGHICRRHPAQVPMIKKEDVQQKLNESHCLLLGNGKKATQTVFMKKDVVDRLEPLIRGNLYVEVHRP